MLPIRDELPTRHPAIVCRGVIVLCVLVFVLTLGWLDEAVVRFGAVAFHFTGQVPDVFGLPEGMRPVPADGTAWLRAVTHMFLHGGFLHLAMNVWFLWIFGDNVEERLGHGRFAIFYLACGLAALAAQVLAAPASAVPMIGASGAISGVLGGYVVLYPRSPILTLIPLGFIPFFVHLPAVLFLGSWAILQVLSGVLDVGGQGGVAWWAHAGGFAAGLLLVKPLSRPRPRERAERVAVKEW